MRSGGGLLSVVGKLVFPAGDELSSSLFNNRLDP